MKSRYTDDGSDIYKGKLVLKLNSSDIHYFDKGIYKCEVNMKNIISSVGLYWNTTMVNWAGMFVHWTFSSYLCIFILLSAFRLIKHGVITHADLQKCLNYTLKEYF